MAEIEDVPASDPERADAPPPSALPSWRPLVAIALVVLGVTGTFAPDSAGAIAYVGTLCGVALVVLFVSLRQAGRSPAWRYVGMGITLWATAGFLSTLRHDADITSIPQLAVSICSAMGYVPMLIGIADLCDPHRRIRRLTTAVDGVLLILALNAVLWLAVVEQVIGRSSLPKIDRAFNALYPAGDMALLLLGFRIVISRAARHDVGALLVGAFSLNGFAHLALLITQLDQPNGSAPLVDLTSLIGLSLLGLAAMRSLSGPPPIVAENTTPISLTVLVAVSSLAPPLFLGAVVLFSDRTVGLGPIAGWMLLAVSAAVLRHVSSVREVERTHEEAVWMATHDPATDLLSRDAFLQLVSDGSLRDRSGSVLVVEALGLQSLSDARGHDAVDHVMAALAARVRTAAGDGAVVARLSHDQIAAFLRAADLARGRQVADGLQRTLATGVPWGDATLPLAAVVGLAQADGAVIDVHGGLRRAAGAARLGRARGAGHIAIDADITGWSGAAQPAGHPARRDVIAPYPV